MIKVSRLALILVAGVATLFGTAALQAGRPANADVTKPRVWQIRDIKAVGFGREKPAEISTEEQFERTFGKDALAKVRGRVDFTREKVLFVTWAGSSSSYLAFAVKEEKGKVRVVIAIKMPRLALADYRRHGALLVMPKDASWAFGPLAKIRELARP